MAKRQTTPELPDHQFGLHWPKLPLWNTEYNRRRFCSLNNLGNVPQWEHRKWLCKFLWPSEDVLSWHAWSDRRAESTCHRNWVTWLGPGGSGKSTDAAALALQYWIENPDETAIVVCSTSMVMLKRRIWSELVRLHAAMNPEIREKGELLPSGTIIRWKHGDDKHGIFGIAVEDGPVEEARNKLVGIHAKRVWWIIDEMQGIEAALLDGYTLGNLAKNPEARLLGMGNPSNLEDQLCRHSEPLAGWPSVDKDRDERWYTHGGPNDERGGLCVYFDGRKSPACIDPEWGKKHPWMINRKQIENHLRYVHGNQDDPAFSSQSVGFPPTLGGQTTVLDPVMISSFHCKDRATWTGRSELLASFDPAFSFGGDRRILQFLRVGKVSDELGTRWQIEFLDWVNVPISSKSKLSIHHQMVEFVMNECKRRGMQPRDLGIDSSGEGGGLLSIFQEKWGQGVVGIEFGGGPSEMPVKTVVDENGKEITKTAKEVYDRRVAELNLILRDFAMANGIRGMSQEIATQACARKTYFKNKKWGVQPKSEMAESPDNLDAGAIGCEMARLRGAIPTVIITANSNANWQAIVLKASEEFSSDNYTHSQDWSQEIA